MGQVGRGSQCTRGISKCDISKTEILINEACKFCPDESQPLSNMSSIMAFNWLDAVCGYSFFWHEALINALNPDHALVLCIVFFNIFNLDVSVL
jgi:hypothetical protein